MFLLFIFFGLLGLLGLLSSLLGILDSFRGVLAFALGCFVRFSALVVEAGVLQ